ncbi:hypothetical protein [Candidatus Hakubella thermalkaliphila]|uniref:hypothetical protein n=1 Tax=Candidatus Hakubella thermalkaliphila TaxID=2754717 RepID=UPI002158DD74|nr:hypothetical protein [Candidatus Hakubella thermalkaliphila]
MSTLGAATAWKQPGDTLRLKDRLRFVKSLATEAERFGHFRDRPALHLMAPEHLVLDLNPVVGIAKLLTAEGFVPNRVGIRMQSTLLAQEGNLGLPILMWFRSRHGCNLNYIHLKADVKSFYSFITLNIRSFKAYSGPSTGAYLEVW